MENARVQILISTLEQLFVQLVLIQSLLVQNALQQQFAHNVTRLYFTLFKGTYVIVLTSTQKSQVCVISVLHLWMDVLLVRVLQFVLRVIVLSFFS